MIKFSISTIDKILTAAKNVAAAFSALSRVFPSSARQPSEDFQFLDNFPDDMTGIFSSCELTGAYNYTSSYGSGSRGAVPGSESKYDYSDDDVQIDFYFYDTNLNITNSYRNEGIASLTICEYNTYQKDPVYLRFNINGYIIPRKDSDSKRSFAIKMKKVETIDFCGVKLYENTSMSFNCPELKRIRLCSTFYDQIKDSIPEGVEVYINDL